MLPRVYELKKEVIIFLEFQEKYNFLTIFKDGMFQWQLAYLTEYLVPRMS